MASVRRDSAGDSKLEVSGLPSAAGIGITVTGWIRHMVDRGDWSVGWSHDEDSTARYQYLSNSGNNVTWRVYTTGNPDNLILYGNPSSGDWYFVAWTVQANGNVEGWWKQDGDPGLTAAGTISNQPDIRAAQTHFQVFDSPWGGEWLNGSVTALKVWNAVLTQTEIEAEMNQRAAARTAGLVGEWHLDGVGDWLDQSGNGNDLTGGAGLSTDPDEPNDLAAGPPVEQRTVEISGGGTVTVQAQGSESAQRTVEISGGGTVTVQAQGSESAQRTVEISGGGTVAITAVGTEPEQGTATVEISGGGTVTVEAVPNARRFLAISGGGTVAIVAVPTELGTATVQISGGGTVTIDTAAGARRAITVSGGGTVTVQAQGSEAAQRTVEISGGGTVTITAFGQVPGSRFVVISGGGRVTITIGGPFVSPRVELEQIIRAAVGAEWTVYGYPPENLVAPAMVIRPADPYQAPNDLGATVWALWVDVTVARTKVEYALARIEQGMEEIRQALAGTGWRWIQSSEPDDPDVAGRNYLRSAIGVGYVQSDN